MQNETRLPPQRRGPHQRRFARGSIPDAIARALAINPAAGTTFRDAEHVVILMQENRSFDHSYGALRGVRGFRDPRAHVQPNGNPVWFQTDAKGDTYAPFRLDITATNATWIGGLPHTWPDQIDARNGGRYDKWLIAKPKRDLPFTLGHYARADIPFYYAFADAFTVCDQAFCSSLTGTTANRLYLWTGNIRRDAADVARVMNGDTVYDREASWPTFPERLEDAGVSWRIYQNEISIDSGSERGRGRLARSFGDNPIEWFTQYNIRFATSRRAYLPKFLAEAPGQLQAKERALRATNLAPDALEKLQKEIAALKAAIQSGEAERAKYTDAAWTALSARAKSLHQKAFTTNTGDPAYRSLAKLAYQNGDEPKRETRVPAGDILHQFRHDVVDGRAAGRLVDRRTGELLRPPELGVVRRVVRLRSARHPHEESRGLEEDRLHSLLRRERRVLRPRAAVRRAASVAAGDGRRVSGASTRRMSGRTSTGAKARSGSAIAYRW